MRNVDELKISIIVPVYNAEKYLERCIESILSQSFINLEIILIDDGSTDKSAQICDEYAKLDERILVIHQDNQGVSMARNKGINISSGDYITFVDGDDTVSVDYIDYLVHIAIEYDADISVCRILDCINGREDKDDKKNVFVLNNEQAVEMMFYQKEFTTSVSGKLYKKTYKERIKFPINMKHEDFAIMYKVLYSAERIVYGQRQLYHYIHHIGSFSHSEEFNKKYYDLYTICLQIEKFIVGKSEKIRRAGISRIFSCYTQILLVLYEKQSNQILFEEIWEWIKKHRIDIITNRDNRKKNRLAAFISFFGVKIYLSVYKHQGRKRVTV